MRLSIFTVTVGLFSVCKQLELSHQAGVNVAVLDVGAVTLPADEHCHLGLSPLIHEPDIWDFDKKFFCLKHWDGIY